MLACPDVLARFRVCRGLDVAHAVEYMVTRSAPPPCPPKVNGQDVGGAPPPLWCGVWGEHGVWSLGFTVKNHKASSRQGLREDLGCRFVRVDGLCSALGLEPAFRFRRGLGLGV